ncbi:hypothetical protein AAG747_27435 [Rapidithrix thailandica]|uniref:Uncharacterized protein n=1 Tax=Rapidithrix thailandica TaxID=413964 RepID=A0AAW9SFK9_9BACT
MVDNIEKIKALLSFESEDDFYFLQVLQRKKENESTANRVIKSYFIKSMEHLDQVYDEVKQLCELFHARAMIRLNKRSFYKTSFKALVNISNALSNNDFKNVSKQYEKACGQYHNDSDKTWIVDIDGPVEEGFIKKIGEVINTCAPEGEKVVTCLPSNSGWHLITKPFNLHRFKEFGYTLDIHKDNPTNLYIP